MVDSNKNIMDVCRICLSNHAGKDISELETSNKVVNKNYIEMIMFCLDIRIEDKSKTSTKLCSKCCRKIVAFHKFKSLALKNDEYIKSLGVVNNMIVKNEVYINDVKDEQLSIDDDLNAGDMLNETTVKIEDHSESEDEFLSVIKRIKYEYVEDVKEDAPIKRGQKAKKSKISKPIEKHVCDECGLAVKDLKSHMYSHKPLAVRKRYKCKHCDMMFSSASSNYKHMRHKHRDVKQACKLCNKVVTYMKLHHRRVHEPETLPFACLLCQRRFLSNAALEGHMTTHTKDRPYTCEVCDKKYSTKTLLQMHKRRVHDKEKAHLCQLCSKSFFKKYHLQLHLRSHSKEKPYECTTCGKFFATSYTLRSHRLIHEDVKTFECQLCDMSFVKRGYLRAHMISHTKEKRYECQYCGFKFGRSDHRKRHEWTAHMKHIAST